MSKFNWKDEAPSSFVRWDEVGKVVHGAVAAISNDGTKYNGEQCPQIVIDSPFGETLIVNVAQANLLKEFGMANPQVGDEITITYVEDLSLSGGRTMKKFNVEVAAGKGHLAVSNGGKAQAEPPF